MNFAHWQYLVWATTLSVEILLLVALRKARGDCSAAVKNYLIVQLASSCVLFPISTSGHPDWYLAGYMFAWAADLAAQIRIIAAVFQEIRGKSNSFGLTRSWLMAGLIIGLGLASVSLRTFPSSLCLFYKAWLPMEQTLTSVRNVCLILLPLFGWVSGSSWPRRASRVWLGLGIYSIADYTISEVNLSQLLKNQEALSFAGALSFLCAALIWLSALTERPSLSDQLAAKAFLEMTRATTDVAQAASQEEN